MSRLYFPATLRNRYPIWELLGQRLEAGQRVLEVASGSGEHLAFFASQSPEVDWTPSDPWEPHRLSQASWCQGLANVASPLDLDCLRQPWPLSQQFDAILAINLLHISPWETTEALFRGSWEWLSPGGWLYTYGAYFREEVETAPSNLAFDLSLRGQNPSWGVRRLREVQKVAESQGFSLQSLVEMPANNLSLFFRREDSRPHSEPNSAGSILEHGL